MKTVSAAILLGIVLVGLLPSGSDATVTADAAFTKAFPHLTDRTWTASMERVAKARILSGTYLGSHQSPAVLSELSPTASALLSRVDEATGLYVVEPPGMPALTGVKDSTYYFSPIYVDADRIRRMRDRARSIHKLDKDELNAFMPATLSDALVSVPGVDVVKTGPWAARPTVRGLSGNRVLVMVDGVRLNSGRGHGAEPNIVGLESVENVEVAMGSSSSRYGTDAMGGVVNIVTRGKLFNDTPQVQARLIGNVSGPGGASSQSGALRYQSPRLGAEISGGLSRLDELITAEGGIDNSGFRQENYSLRAEARLKPFAFDVQHSYGAAKDVGLPAFASPAGGAAVYPVRDRRATRMQLDVDEAGWRPGFSVMGVLQDYDTEFIETTVDSQYVRRRLVAITTNRDNQFITTQMQSIEPTLTLNRGVEVEVFGQYRWEETDGPSVNQQTVANPSGDVVSEEDVPGENVPPSSLRGLGGGIKVAYPNRFVRLESSVRYDDFHTRADSTQYSVASKQDLREFSTSYSVGVARQFKSRRLGFWEPFAHYSTGFRSPNLDERYFDGFIHGGLRIFGNHELAPEESETFELGFRALGLFNGRMPWLRASAYRSNVTDLITLRYVGQLYLVPRFQYVNINDARVDGFEVEAGFQLASVLLDVGAAFPKGTDMDTGEPISDVGRASVTTRLTYSFGERYLDSSLSVRHRWFDRVEDVNDLLNEEPVSVTSLEAGFKYYGVRGALVVRNVFDKYYAQQLSVIPEPGRTFAFSLSREFSFPISH